MAISNIRAFSRLSTTQIASLEADLDALRLEIESMLGAEDADFIRHAIVVHRALEVVGRSILFYSRKPAAFAAGCVILGLAKTIDNILLGHNICHGQWDWMNDPEIHSSSWEWDSVVSASHWKHAHNYSHHTYTNIVGKDEDLSHGIIRMSRDIPWRPIHLFQPVTNLALAATFEWGTAIHHWLVHRHLVGIPRWKLTTEPDRDLGRKIARQVTKEYLLFPLLSGPYWKTTLAANAVAGIVRNIWLYAAIFCGHFPDSAEKFAKIDTASESRGEWYLRQILGTTNFRSGRILAFVTGGLGYQIEHHLFPGIPCNRLPETSRRVQAICEKYGIPYTTGSLLGQFWLSFRTLNKLALPDLLLRRTSHDAPETRSEKVLAIRPTCPGTSKHPRRAVVRMASAGAFALIGVISKTGLALGAKTTTVQGRDQFIATVSDPRRTAGVLVVPNHRSTLDDPLMWGTLPWSVLLRPRLMRWSLGAAELCFTNPVTSTMSSLAQVLATVRGDGIFQPAIDRAISVLDSGGVVNIFSEGRINQGAPTLRFKWGIARLVAESAEAPVLFPVYLGGFEHVAPLPRRRWMPFWGKEIRIVFGTPIDTAPMIAAAHQISSTPEGFRSALTASIRDEVEKLRAEHEDE
ncbi:fatty acid desaturase [Nocardia neocaledoniensis]|uniref:fatty acid desaturase n=1 Tax=Nocardia neocaledoniensis TaxID=236511 RepID=UPI002456EA40|nr:fatty acid desaturase [Nocardia neocaledoniensis]